jgi:putative membrane-bound dehydrogenase-like protein
MHACFDDHGRLFVADSLGINPKRENLRENPSQVIRLLEDTKGTGYFDKSTIFADSLFYPEGVLWHDGVVYTCSPPSLWRLEDSAQKGVADRRRELVTGFPQTGIADDLHGPSLGPDGRIYWGCGRFDHQIHAPGGGVLSKGRAPVLLRCRPDGSEVEVVCGAQGNPVKQAFSSEGESFSCGTWCLGKSGRTDTIIHCVPGGNYPMLDGDFFSPEFKHTAGQLPFVVSFGPMSAAGIVRYRSGAFGPEYRDNLFVALFNHNRITRHVLERDGATFRAKTEDFLVSTDRRFRPTDVIEDADGSLLVIATGLWSRACSEFQTLPEAKIPKFQGGIYRIRRRGATPVLDPRGLKLAWDRLTSRELAGLLDDDRFVVRDRSVDSLSKQGVAAVAVLRDVLNGPGSVRARRNALWALNRIDRDEARAAVRIGLMDKDASVRHTATYLAGLQRDTLAAPRLLELVQSDGPAIRREAATALGRLGQTAKAAVPVLLAALHSAGDAFLEHSLIYALIQIRDREATLAGLGDANPQARRGAVIALDQMDNGNLTHEVIIPLLNTDDPGLQQTVLAIITRRGWAKEIIGLLRSWICQKDMPIQRQESLRGAVLGFCKDAAVQSLVAQTLEGGETPVAVRLLLLEVMARAPLERLPKDWISALGRSLGDADERVAQQVVAIIQRHAVSQYDEQLVHLAKAANKPADLRVSAIAATADRLPKLEPGLLDFLTAQLNGDVPPLTRRAAASALGNARLDDAQLLSLVNDVAGADSVALPQLIAAYERSSNPSVGRRVLEALAKSPGLPTLSPEHLRRVLKTYPPEIMQAAGPLFRRLTLDIEKMQERLAELEPILTGGDSARGRDVFFGRKGSCFACHMVQSQGGQVGPDLSKIGATRANRELLAAVIFPSATFVRGFEPYVVATTSGRVYTGVLRRETTDAIYLVTGDRSEIGISRRDIDSLAPSKVSIMPQGLDAQLSKQEMRDLIAFLTSLK